MTATSLIITLGDPAGIGPEVTGKALTAIRDEISDDVRVVLVGAIDALPEVDALRVDLRDLGDAPREPGADSGRVALRSLHAALQELNDCVTAGERTALVTAPVAKSGLVAAGARFLDHTTLLGAVTGRDPIMSFVGGGFRVSLATVHVPLMTVASHLRVESLARLIVRSGRDLGGRDGVAQPVRVAVCGLNPHAGEGGLMGDEDDHVILPAIELARDWLRNGFADGAATGDPGDPGDESIDITTDGSLARLPIIGAGTSMPALPAMEISGPLPGDTVFHRARTGDFDVVVAMYHDEGLIPVKTVAFHDAVNATINLPFIRTSPDHGTAYDIAGKGIADPGSMTAALRLAHRWLHQAFGKRSVSR